jgi:hypothetical protein
MKFFDAIVGVSSACRAGNFMITRDGVAWWAWRRCCADGRHDHVDETPVLGGATPT